MTTERINFLYSILDDAKLAASNSEMPLRYILAHAAMMSEWGKKPIGFDELAKVDMEGLNKYYSMALRQISDSKIVERICGAVDCALEP